MQHKLDKNKLQPLWLKESFFYNERQYVRKSDYDGRLDYWEVYTMSGELGEVCSSLSEVLEELYQFKKFTYSKAGSPHYTITKIS